MVGPCEDPGIDCPGNVLDEIRVIISLGQVEERIVVCRVGPAQMIFARGASTASANEGEASPVPGYSADLLIGRTMKSVPVRLCDTPLPRRNVNARYPLRI